MSDGSAPLKKHSGRSRVIEVTSSVFDEPTVGSKDQALANARRLVAAGDFLAAQEQAQEILDGDDRCAAAYRVLGIALRASGEVIRAREAETAAIRESGFNQDIFQAVLKMADNRLDAAEQLIRGHLRLEPDDALALRLLAEIAARLSRHDAAEKLAMQALAIAPDYTAARSLLDQIRALDRPRSKDDASQFPRVLRTGGTTATAQYSEALELYERVVERFPESADNWVSYGHILRTAGRQNEAIAAYRRAISVRESCGEAWWALADLKTRELGSEDIARLTNLLAQTDIPSDDRPRLHFALGRAHEQADQFEASFHHYQKGNRLRAEAQPFDRAAVARHVDTSIRTFDAGFFQAREDAGFDAPDPIFVLGMPRAGSTLIEQILASHHQVEGTMELPDALVIANSLADGRQAGFEDSHYLTALEKLAASDLRRLGQGYIWGTGLRRQTHKPLFIDKMPNNWLHVGMILAILPNARIIDARRHPMACGFSIYRQHFAKGQEFSYDLADIGSFYSDYVRMMAHFDRIMPGRIIRVIHEQLVADPERQISLLLERLALPFDENCLRFHENKRAVRTSSSEQVRRPINREGLDQWRAFEPWLGPLKHALGPIVDLYPAVPDMSDR